MAPPRFSGKDSRKTFSATESCGIRASSWNTTLMPLRRESWALCSSRGAPSNRISPESLRYTPARILISVDLPAPFSPTRAWISPRRRVRSTPARAFTPGNSLVILRTSRMTSLSFMAFSRW